MLLYLGLFCYVTLAQIQCTETLDVAAGGGPCALCVNAGQQCFQAGAQATTHGKCFDNNGVKSCALFCKSWIATAANVNQCLDVGKSPKADDQSMPLQTGANFVDTCCKINNQLKNCAASPAVEAKSATITRIFIKGQTLRQAYNALINAGMTALLASKIESCCHAGGMLTSPDYNLHMTIKHATSGGHVSCAGASTTYQAGSAAWNQVEPADWDTKDVAGFQALFPGTAEQTEDYVSSAAFSIRDHQTLVLFACVVSAAALIYLLSASKKTTLEVEFESALI